MGNIFLLSKKKTHYFSVLVKRFIISMLRL